MYLCLFIHVFVDVCAYVCELGQRDELLVALGLYEIPNSGA